MGPVRRRPREYPLAWTWPTSKARHIAEQSGRLSARIASDRFRATLFGRVVTPAGTGVSTIAGGTYASKS
ncbi:hypothetical protein NORO109296_18710 [Nocardiopsis rhodophaea]